MKSQKWWFQKTFFKFPDDNKFLKVVFFEYPSLGKFTKKNIREMSRVKSK